MAQEGKELDGPDETEDANCVFVADSVDWAGGAEGKELELCAADVLGAEL